MDILINYDKYRVKIHEFYNEVKVKEFFYLSRWNFHFGDL